MFKMCRTSAAPLLVIHETTLKQAKKTLKFLGEFWKSASSPRPVNRPSFEIASNSLMCSKRKENQYILRAFDVLDVLDRVDVSSMTF